MHKLLMKVFILVNVGLILFIGCSSAASSTDVNDTHTPEKPSELEQMLVFPEDMGWPSSAYRLYDGVIDTADKAINRQKISMYLSTVGIDRPSSRSAASQSVSLYTNNNAVEEYNFFLGTTSRANYWPAIDFIPKTENVITECTHVSEPTLGEEWYNCNIIIQAGSYVTFAGMSVDEDRVTFKDWERYINLVQDRFLEYAGVSVE